MSADIYIKAFTDEPPWLHACKLINVFRSEGISEESFGKWPEHRRLVGREHEVVQSNAVICRNAVRMREGRAKAIAKAAATASANADISVKFVVKTACVLDSGIDSFEHDIVCDEGNSNC